MKNAKRIIAMLLGLIIALSLGACGSGAGNSGGKSYTIGLCNYVDDASLNQIVENIQNRLTEIGQEKGVTFNVKYANCNADAAVLNQIIANFQADGVDLMIGVATPVAMAMQSATEDSKIPVVFSAVSDPLAVGLVESKENPGANITGTSDYLNTDAVINLMFAANPGLKKVGLLYNIGQDASTGPIESAKKIFADRGVEVVEATGTNVDEVILAAQSLIASGVEAVFTPTDNTVMTAELSIYEAFAEAKIPHYCGADSFALNGAFLGYGVDYANLGVETANMAADILLNGKDPGSVAVMTFDNGIATVNTETCAAIGFDIDEISAAFEPYCTKLQTTVTKEAF